MALNELTSGKNLIEKSIKWSARFKDVLIRENSLADVKSFYTNDGKIFLRTTRSRRQLDLDGMILKYSGMVTDMK